MNCTWTPDFWLVFVCWFLSFCLVLCFLVPVFYCSLAVLSSVCMATQLHLQVSWSVRWPSPEQDWVYAFRKLQSPTSKHKKLQKATHKPGPLPRDLFGCAKEMADICSTGSNCMEVCSKFDECSQHFNRLSSSLAVDTKFFANQEFTNDYKCKI